MCSPDATSYRRTCDITVHSLWPGCRLRWGSYDRSGENQGPKTGARHLSYASIGLTDETWSGI